MTGEFSIDLFKEANSLLAKANRLWDSQEFQESMQCAQKALNIYTNLSEYPIPDYIGVYRENPAPDYIPFFSEWAECLNRLSLLHKMHGNLELAISMASRGLELAEKYNYQTGMGNILNNLASVHARMGNYAQAIQYLNRALELFVSQDNIEYTAHSLNNLGIIYWYLQDFEQSFNYYNKAIHLYKKANVYQNAEAVLVNLGALLIEQKKYDEALPYLNQALQMNTLSGNIRNAAIARLNLGNVYYHLKDFDSALEYYYISLDLHQKTGMKSGAASLMGNIALILDDKQYIHYNQEKAVDFLTKAIKLQKETSEVRSLITLTKNMVSILAEQGKWHMACKYLQEAYIMEKELKLNDHNKSIEKVRIELLERQKNLLQQKNAELEIMHKDKNEFMNIASADLKQPLAFVYQMADTLHSDKSLSTQYIESLHRQILHKSRNMFEIISRLLDVNAIEQGRVRIVPVKTDITVLLNEVIEEFRIQAGRKNIDILFSEHNSFFCLCDKYYTLQILRHLLSNAVKFSPQNTSIYIYCTLIDQYVSIAVQDQGPGLTELDQTKLFTKFARLSAIPTNGESSTGLGLSIAHNLAGLMNATLSCHSIYGQGATFILNLPALYQ
jgi:signal transduction histidine kinase/Tfp pilus assembly protein PilF